MHLPPFLSSEWQFPSLTNFCIPSHCSAKQDNQRATLSPQNMYVIKVKKITENVPSPSTCSIQLFLVSSSCFSLLQLQRRPLVLLCVYSPQLSCQGPPGFTEMQKTNKIMEHTHTQGQSQQISRSSIFPETNSPLKEACSFHPFVEFCNICFIYRKMGGGGVKIN